MPVCLTLTEIPLDLAVANPTRVCELMTIPAPVVKGQLVSFGDTPGNSFVVQEVNNVFENNRPGVMHQRATAIRLSDYHARKERIRLERKVAADPRTTYMATVGYTIGAFIGGWAIAKLLALAVKWLWFPNAGPWDGTLTGIIIALYAIFVNAPKKSISPQTLPKP